MALLLSIGCVNTIESKNNNSANLTEESKTFVNPVIYSDVPDPSVIRVDDTFYMVSTTMHMMPGAPIMKSKDLVNWEIVSYVYDRLEDSPKYNLEKGSVYGRGQWATSLRYHNNKFYVFFGTNDPGLSYVYTADDPAGTWTLHSKIPKFHDASLFFDDDGKVYLAHGTGWITELKEDLTDVKQGGFNKQVFKGDKEDNGLLEGTHMIKHDGKYYLQLISWPQGGIRREVCYRADNIAGPYEKKVVLENAFDKHGGVAQGTVIDTKDGNWYGFLFQDRGGIGRVPVLVPCRWEDGWPMLGDEKGNVPKVMEKPIQGYSETPLVISDEFNSPKLALNWQWNHNPDNSLWSLTEREGYMRLKTGKVVKNIFEARNTLTQRTEGAKCSGVVALDLTNMKDGDVTGFGVFANTVGLLSVTKKGKKKTLEMNTSKMLLSNPDQRIISGAENESKEQVKFSEDVIYLRIDCDFSLYVDNAKFYYSFDKTDWKEIGEDFKMLYELTHFMGYRYAIFNYASKSAGGYVDIDFFEYNNEK